MRSSLFRSKVPRALLVEFLKDVGHIEPNGVLVNDELLKRRGRNARVAVFLSAAATYYYPSKRHYVRQVHNAKTLMTVVRQACRTHSIGVRSRTVYQHGGYMINYTIVTNESILADTPDT
jgi:hypothetical protein